MTYWYGLLPEGAIARAGAAFTRRQDQEGSTRQTARVRAVIAELGLSCRNASGLPILELPLAEADDLSAVGRFLFERGVNVTLAAYPLVPCSEVGFRIQVTAANTSTRSTISPRP